MEINLSRFVDAENKYFETALQEIKNGKKISHWMWYIFPQIQGLGMSSISIQYAIDDLEEAKAYLANEKLRKNLIEISETLLHNDSNDAREIMGFPDDLKLCSSMTLFALADEKCDVFQQVLNKFFDGKKDQRTIDIINKQNETR